MTWVVFAVLWLVLCSLAVVIVASGNWIASRRAAAKTRAAIEERTVDAVVLRGRLRIEGEAAEGTWGGKLAAASSIHSRRRLGPKEVVVEDGGARCARMWLDTSDGAVLLEGPLAVEIGSRQRWLGAVTRDGTGNWFGAEFAVFDGDEVTVAGVREGAPVSTAQTDSQYRKAATHDVLSPLQSGRLAVAALKGHRWLPVRQAVRHRLFVPLALAALFPAGRAASSYADTEESCAEHCDVSGRCAVGLDPGDSLSAIAKRAYRGDVFTCVAQDDAACQRSTYCLQSGACAAVDGDCVATTREHCSHTASCLLAGMCSPVDGYCRALTEEDCRATNGCLENGDCTPVEGFCKARSDVDCAASDNCKSIGYCTNVGDECRAAKDADCVWTESCRFLGICSAREGGCVRAKNEDCHATYGCRGGGRCTHKAGECIVDSDADCLRSDDCKSEARCRAFEGTCVKDGPCRESAACRVLGRCEGDDYCTVESNADCEASEGCKNAGACKRIDGVCAKSCADLEICHDDGKCTEVDGKCTAASDAECRASKACLHHGKCTAIGGRCLARSADDCKRSAACRGGNGHCTHKDDECVVGVDDCMGTRNCRRIGWCKADGNSCGQGRADEHCQRSPECKRFGRCGWTGYRCESGSDADCAQSELCARYGWCKHTPDGCFARAKI